MDDPIDPQCNKWMKDCLDLDPDDYADVTADDDASPMQGGSPSPPKPSAPALAPTGKGTFTINAAPDDKIAVKCSGVVDFVAKAPGVLKQAHGFGVTRVHYNKPDVKTDASGKVTDVTFSVDITTRRAVADGNFSQNDETALRQGEALNETHEHTHQSDYKAILNAKFDQAFMTGLIGKTAADAKKAIKAKGDDANAEIRKKTAELDGKEGATDFHHNSNGSWTVSLVPAH
jgi:hypothetical protein